MPKKFPTENTKAVQARARKADAKAAEKAKSDKEKEDAAWRDDNRQLAKKQQRKVIIYNVLPLKQCVLESDF